MNAVYPTFKARLLELLVGSGMPGGAVLNVVGVSDSYVYDPAHTTLDNVPPESILIPLTELTGGITNGTTIDADDVELNGVGTGSALQAVIVCFTWADQSALVAYLDSTENMSLPQDLITGQVLIEWSDSGICRI